MAYYTVMEACRICKGDEVETVMDLGEQVIASQFPAAGEPTPPSIPLVLVRCASCGLVQLKHSAVPGELYCKTYGYRSGLNQTMTQHLKGIVMEAWDASAAGAAAAETVVVDIGSNDATLLKWYDEVAPGVKMRRIGIDPTGTQFKEHYPPEIELMPDYFTADAAARAGIRPGSVRILTSIAMFYDLPDPVGFARDVAGLLAPEGIWIMEQSYMPTMIEKRSFDTICHEHLEYYTLTDIQHIAERAGLRVIRVAFNDCNGGSFRVMLCREGALYPQGEEVATVLRKEAENPVDFEKFKEACDQQRDRLVPFLKNMVAQGKSIYLYGASTKGNTLLQYYGIDHTMIRGAAERNPTKYGCRTPKTDIPILSEAEVRAAQPDFMLVLPWHFREEFLAREQAYLEAGGEFIFPLPEAHIVSRKKKALITGARGQMGRYMGERLRAEGYKVYEVGRKEGSEEAQQTRRFWTNILKLVEPDIVYDFAACSVGYTGGGGARPIEDMLRCNGVRPVALLAAIADLPKKKQPVVFVSNSVELWRGAGQEMVCIRDKYALPAPCPTTPYGMAKAMLYWAVQSYRKQGLTIYQGIFSNIESQYRSEDFVLRKIGRALTSGGELELGNIEVYRDWLHAKDAIEAVFLYTTGAGVGEGAGADFIVASGVSRRLDEVLADMIRLAGKTPEEVRVRVNPASHPDPNDYGKRYYITDRLSEIGWSPRYSLDELLMDVMVF